MSVSVQIVRGPRHDSKYLKIETSRFSQSQLLTPVGRCSASKRREIKEYSQDVLVQPAALEVGAQI